MAIIVATSAAAQTTPAGNRAQISGTVTAVNADAKQLSLKGDKGENVSVTTTDRTLILRIPPGETDPKKGSKIELSTLGAGDRAVVIGPAPSDPKTWVATAVLIMSKSDVAGLQQKDQEDWKKRGTTGTVTAVDSAAHDRQHQERIAHLHRAAFRQDFISSLLRRFGPLCRRQAQQLRGNQNRRPVTRPG